MFPLITRDHIQKISDVLFEISASFHPEMRVPARVFVNEKLLDAILSDRSLQQIAHVTTLPGIKKAAYAMPDIHQGYGFPIGGVAATAIEDGGVISPGGIGYDINCGVRLLSIGSSAQELKKILPTLAHAINDAIPSGIGKGGNYKLSPNDLDAILRDGAHELVNRGIGNEEDLLFCEENGRMKTADARLVSEHAKKRGHDQLGTLGSGNHFLEIQRVAEIYDPEVARIFGLSEDMLTIMIHCGSRGLGHQTCTDHVQTMIHQPSTVINLPDRELACAPFLSAQGQAYFGAMGAAANFAWANRHCIAHEVRQVCKKILGRAVPVRTVYDVCHNIGKREQHIIDGILTDLIVHRKGATRAFPAHHPDVPQPYQKTGHPVLIPGTMGTASYIMVGTEEGMQQAFGSCAHGAGRAMSRTQAKSKIRGPALRGQLESQGIIVCCNSDRELTEEAPFAYKNVHEVIGILEQAQLARKIARVEPLAVIKGN